MFSKILLAIIILQLILDNEGDNVEVGPPKVVAQPPVATTECAHHKNKNGGKKHKGGKGAFLKKHKGTKKPKKNKNGRKTKPPQV
ncbi:unnamed protein product [Meloidogyne enterolobii]|uniref:Uncharacterized protein n=1 Tax=Meloidogyne enterolobii TaxID=390850 RepID=A0ACB0ZKX2_MELEN